MGFQDQLWMRWKWKCWGKWKNCWKEDLKLIQKEIGRVLRLISGSVSFLPLLECLCSFDLQVYTNLGCEVPDLKLIQKEIGRVLRLISGTVSFLPLLECLCSFDLHVYKNLGCEVPEKWDETQPCIIKTICKHYPFEHFPHPFIK